MASYLPEYDSESMSSEGSEEETWDSNSHTSSDVPLTWISWWCRHVGHEYFTEVPEEFIEDDFNMTGLSSMVPLYREALEMILDLEPENGVYPAAEQDAIEASAEMLYGLIHQRYIISRNGLLAMEEKYNDEDFGVCPRTLCRKTSVLPVGLSDVLEYDYVKLFCPSCLDIYTPPNSRFNEVDGAYFGTTFPHLFLMTFTDIEPKIFYPTQECYTPKIYGFNVSALAPSGPRMRWLREGLNGGPRIGNNDNDSNDIPELAEPDRPDTSMRDHSGHTLDPRGDEQGDEDRSLQSKAQANSRGSSAIGSQKSAASSRNNGGNVGSTAQTRSQVVAVRESRGTVQ